MKAAIRIPAQQLRYGIALLVLAAGCDSAQSLLDDPRPANAHDAYTQSLREAGLADSALGRDWLEVSEASLQHALSVDTPFRETFFVERNRAFAVAYRFRVRRGHRAEIEVEVQTPRRGRLFLDLFQVTQAPVSQWERVASAADAESRLAFEPRVDGDYVLRLQPELLRGGTTTVEIRNVALLTFPVDRGGPADIGSRFGAPRDGGQRSHHGVDIFAPRHTPVVAASSGRVRRVGTNRLGGLVIWLYDDQRSLNFYYAHLQSQSVARGDTVQAGQVIGTVGNSGNARTTPPHLHFGIYARGEGPIDPDNFLHQPAGVVLPVEVDTRLVGDWGRTSTESALTDPAGRSITRVPGSTPVRLLAGRDSRFRVSLPDGTIGFLPGSQVESADVALTAIALPEPVRLWPRPGFDDHPLYRLDAGSHLETLGFSAGFQMVRTPSGALGWHRLPEPAPPTATADGPE